MILNSLYDISNRTGEELLNTGFDYKSNNILLQSMVSSYLLKNDILTEFINNINDIVINNIETVKKLRIHNNFTVDKNTKYIN